MVETLISLVFGATFLTAPLNAEALTLIEPIPPPPVEEQICNVIQNYDLECQTILNLAMSESSMNPDAVGRHGERGLYQIHPIHHAVTDECAFDVSCATQWIAGRFLEGYSYENVPCNCYSYVSLSVSLPKMAEVIPNTYPKVGSVAVFEYRIGKHVAIVTKITEKGFYVREANFRPCKFGTRFVAWSNPFLKGFYSPPTSLATN